MKFKRILCGVDFSPTSVRAFETAVDLTRSSQAELHVMHIIEVEPPVAALPPVRGVVGEAILTLEEQALKAMEALVASSSMADASPRLTIEVTVGRAFVEIVARARDRRVDLIVLGAKGLTLPEEAFLGGTAEQVMKEAVCSVLLVRES